MPDKPSVLLTEPVFPDVMELLKLHTNLTVGERGTYNSESALCDVIERYDGILTMLSNPITDKVINQGVNLKIISNYAVGYNNIQVDTATKKGIWVANTPDVLTRTTAEGTFALILATCRRLSTAENALRNGEFDGWHPTGFLGMDLTGKTLGILGMGRIGTELARLSKAFGLKIVYHNRQRVSATIEEELNAQYFPELESFISACDILSLNCPLNDETYHLMNEQTLSFMKKDSILINTARGPVVDEAAMAKALHNQSIWGAGLDVFEHEPKVHPDLLTAPNTVLLPHITSATYTTRRAMGMLAAGAILNVLCQKDMKCYFVNR